MTISKQSRLYRAYAWCIWLQTEFKGSSLDHDYLNEGTNLCHFVRTLTVTTPAVIILQLVTYGMLIAAIFVQPFRIFGVGGPLTFVGLIAFVGVVVLLASAYQLYKKKKAPPSDIPPEPTFTSVLKDYVKAKKSKICPLISWKDGQ